MQKITTGCLSFSCQTKYDPLSCPINFYTTTHTKLFEGEKFFKLLINYK